MSDRQRDRGRTRRGLALVTVAGLLVAAFLVARDRDATDVGTTATPPVAPADVMPVAQPAGSTGSTWFCPAGAPDAEPGTYTQAVVVSGADDREQRVAVTAMALDGQRAGTSVLLPARGRVEVDLGELGVTGPVSALVETDGGLVVVEQAVSGPQGAALSSCSTTSSPAWYLPAGTTRLGTRQIVALFNPFPDQASVDLAFETDDGTRESPRFQGMVVPAGGTILADITETITVRDQISTAVRTRSGRLVVSGLLVTDDGPERSAGLTPLPAAPAPSPVWLFAAGPSLESVPEQRITVFNPGAIDAEVEVQPQSDAPGLAGQVEPYRVTVRAGRYAAVSLGDDRRLPPEVGSWLVVRTLVGPPIVAARTLGRPVDSGGETLAVGLGAPLVATEWLAPAPTATGATGQVAVTNPSAGEDAVLRVVASGPDGTTVLPEFDQVVLAAGARTVLDLGGLAEVAPDATVVAVSASSGVVVERLVEVGDPASWTDGPAVPVVTTAAFAPADLYERSTASPPPALPDGGGPGTVPPGTAGPDTTAPGTSEPGTTTPAADDPATTTTATDAVDPTATPSTDVVETTTTEPPAAAPG